MGRTRSLKPSFFTNDELGQLDPLARLLFAGLWTMADRDGRLFDRPLKIKAEALPYDAVDVDLLLTLLAEHGFIRRYSADGQGCIAIITWAKHQQPHGREPESEIPPPPGCDTGRTTRADQVEVGRLEPDMTEGACRPRAHVPEPGTGNPEPGNRNPEPHSPEPAAPAAAAAVESGPAGEAFSTDEREKVDAAMAVLGRFGLDAPPRFWRQVLDTYPGQDLEAVAIDIADWLRRHSKKTCSTSLVRSWLARGPNEPTGRAARAPNGAELAAADARWAHLVKA